MSDKQLKRRLGVAIKCKSCGHTNTHMIYCSGLIDGRKKAGELKCPKCSSNNLHFGDWAWY